MCVWCVCDHWIITIRHFFPFPPRQCNTQTQTQPQTQTHHRSVWRRESTGQLLRRLARCRGTSEVDRRRVSTTVTAPAPVLRRRRGVRRRGGAEESTRQLPSQSPPRAAASPRARPYPPCVRRIRPAADASPRLAGRASRADGEHRAPTCQSPRVRRAACAGMKIQAGCGAFGWKPAEKYIILHSIESRAPSARILNFCAACAQCIVRKLSGIITDRSLARRSRRRNTDELPSAGSSGEALAQCLGNFERLACARLPGNNIGSLTAFAKETMRILLTVPT
jgi:hypothetical protein